MEVFDMMVMPDNVRIQRKNIDGIKWIDADEEKILTIDFIKEQMRYGKIIFLTSDAESLLYFSKNTNDLLKIKRSAFVMQCNKEKMK